MIDYTIYDVITKAGNVMGLVKDSDEHMAVGPLKRPKATFLLGYTREQAAQRFEDFLKSRVKRIAHKQKVKSIPVAKVLLNNIRFGE